MSFLDDLNSGFDTGSDGGDFDVDPTIGNSDTGGLDLSGIDNLDTVPAPLSTGTDTTGGFLSGLNTLGSNLLQGYNSVSGLIGSVSNGLNTPTDPTSQDYANAYGSAGYQAPTQTTPTASTSSSTTLLYVGGAALLLFLIAG